MNYNKSIEFLIMLDIKDSFTYLCMYISKKKKNYNRVLPSDFYFAFIQLVPLQYRCQSGLSRS